MSSSFRPGACNILWHSRIDFFETNSNSTYNVGTNTFTFIVNGITSTNPTFDFNIPIGSGGGSFGDNLADGSIEFQGASITFPNTTVTPKNYKVDLIINFNGSGTYTITQI